MDTTDWLMSMTAVCVAIFAVVMFGAWPALGVTGLWLVWIVGAGLVAVGETYRDSDD